MPNSFNVIRGEYTGNHVQTIVPSICYDAMPDYQTMRRVLSAKQNGSMLVLD
jgi:hypothetical protein